MEQGRILIVDDEADIREILQFNLENAGYDVDCAASAEEALEILTPRHSLILLDVMMDGMSGFKMAEVVRKEKEQEVPRTTSLPDFPQGVTTISASRFPYMRCSPG